MIDSKEIKIGDIAEIKYSIIQRIVISNYKPTKLNYIKVING